jgi:preprotein translocase subunit SecD
VFVNLDGQGARRMRNMTTENVGKPMAVVFIENRTVTRMVDGEPVKERVRTEEVISVANILEPFGRRFQTTGLDSSDEAHNLALLLRAGALAAPIEIVEERTIGPSLGPGQHRSGLPLGADRPGWWWSSWPLLPCLRPGGGPGAGREPGHDRRHPVACCRPR